ncbi:hypothetical protein VTK26DRAFT_97 [Humicola hyalothermophila]
MTSANLGPGFGDLHTAQPFGYRDIYKTRKAWLYRALRAGPSSRAARYFDWQLWGEDATPELKTLMPWDEQPDPLAVYLDEAFFQLEIPWANNDGDNSLPEGTHAAVEQSQRDSQFAIDGQTDVERGLRMREYSYAHPLDVQMEKAIPINAPPVDALLNLRQDSVPVVSLSVLTPTEVRRLQKDYYDMRNLALSRTQRCPYKGCEVSIPANWPKAMQQHLRDKHVAEKCNFCDELLYRHWSSKQRFEHLVSKHSSILELIQTHPRDNKVDVPAEAHTDRAREGRWKFCSRCGRDHTVLNAGPDRAHHDSVCYPGVQDREPDWSACVTCGYHIAKGAGQTGSSHVHDEDASPDDVPFCEGCALPLGRFSEGYRKKHATFCKGHGRDNAKYCPWCSIELGWDFMARAQHTEQCSQRPSPDAQGPIDTRTWSYHLPGLQRTSPTSSQAPKQDGNQARKTAKKKRKEAPTIMATISAPPKR